VAVRERQNRSWTEHVYLTRERRSRSGVITRQAARIAA
jgi:hypothetical protein